MRIICGQRKDITRVSGKLHNDIGLLHKTSFGSSGHVECRGHMTNVPTF